MTEPTPPPQTQTPPPAQPPPAQPPPAKTTFKDLLAPLVGLAILVAFFLLLRVMFVGHLADEPQQWERALYLFGAVESLAFAAAGFFFGKEVHRQRADSAEARADQASDQAATQGERAADAEARGRSLAASVHAHVEAAKTAGGGGGPRIAGPLEGMKEPTAPAGGPELESLLAVARKLFPAAGG